jgi:hypothetical protein
MESLIKLIKTHEKQLDILKNLTIDRYIIFYELSKLRQNAFYDRKQLYKEYSIIDVDAAFRDILKSINDYIEHIDLKLAARSEYETIVKAKTLFAPETYPKVIFHDGNISCRAISFKSVIEWKNNFNITNVQVVELKSFNLHLSSEEGIARDFYIVYSINKKGEIKFGYSIKSDKDEANPKLAETIAIGRHNKSEKIATLAVSDSFKDRTKFMVKQIVISAVNAIFYDLVNRLVEKENKKGIIK